MSFQTAPIADLATVVTGKTPSTKDEANFGGDIPFVTPAELDLADNITVTPRTLSEKGAAGLKLVPPNSILVCCIGSLGKVGFAGRELATNQQINTVTFDERKVWPRFGYYALRLLKPKMDSLAPATTVKIISKTKFSELEIPVPPLEEQRRIAAILDQADALRRLRRRALDRLNTLGQAIFHEMFFSGDKIEDLGQLGDLVEVGSGNGFPTKYQGNTEGELPFYKVGDMNLPGNETFMSVSRNWITEETARILKAKIFPAGTLIFPKIGAAIATNKKRVLSAPACVDNNVMALIPNGRASKEYLHTFLLGKDLSEIAQPGNPPSIRKGSVEGWAIPIPTSEADVEFQERMNAVADTAIQQTTSLQSMEDLFSSLQHHAFQGEL